MSIVRHPPVSVEALPISSTAEPPAARVAAPAASSDRWFWPDLLLVGLVVLLAFAVIATTAWQIHHRVARESVARHFKAAAAGFQAYLQEHVTAPATADAGEVPGGMAGYLTGADWTSPTPAGGFFRWAKNTATGPGAAAGTISLTAFPPNEPLALTTDDLLEIDRLIDDGNLSTGKLRTGFNGWPVLTVPRAP